MWLHGNVDFMSKVFYSVIKPAALVYYRFNMVGWLFHSPKSIMKITKQLLGLSLFIGMFLTDVYYPIETTWYGLLVFMLSLLFEVKPSNQIVKMIVSLTKKNNDKEK